jgi:serine/threonine-protein kinase
MGRYVVHAQLAAGGMASVYFARLRGPSGFARTVALKRPHPQLAKEREFAMMFIDEARLASRIRHPNVVATLDVIDSDGEIALVMDYVHGESLAKLSEAAEEREERVPLPIAAAILIDALHGLHAAHEATGEDGRPLGIVHRDVSPQNLLVGADGITRIADFGIAKAAGRAISTRDGAIKGKFAYMAPEQIRGEPVSRLTDVYAASIVLWELLTGTRLFDGETEAEIIYKCLQAEIPAPSTLAPDVPAVFDDILRRGLARDPAERYPTAGALAAEIERAVPAVRPSEIGAWVQSLAAETLAARAAIIADMERTDRSGEAELAPTLPASGPTPPRAGHVSQDERRHRVSFEPPTSSSISQVSHAGMVAESAPAPVISRRRSRLGWLLLAAFVGASAGSLLLTKRGAITTPPPPVSAGVGEAGSPPAPSPASPAAAESAAPAPLAGASASAAPSSRGPIPGQHGTRSKHSAACNPPYTIDSSGREIFKLECL